VLLVLLAAATMAHSIAPRFSDVQIGAVSVRIPFPKDYCKPTGKAAAAAQLLAAADDRNVTLLTLVKCGPNASLSDYLIVKTPIEALNADVDRSTLIEMMSKEFDKPEFKAKMGTLANDASNRLSQVGATTVKIDAAIGPRGHDDTCVYMGGSGTENVGNETFPKVMGMCMTAVASRMINLHAYKRATDAQAYQPLLPFLHNWALQLSPTPHR